MSFPKANINRLAQGGGPHDSPKDSRKIPIPSNLDWRLITQNRRKQEIFGSPELTKVRMGLGLGLNRSISNSARKQREDSHLFALLSSFHEQKGIESSGGIPLLLNKTPPGPVPRVFSNKESMLHTTTPSGGAVAGSLTPSLSRLTAKLQRMNPTANKKKARSSPDENDLSPFLFCPFNGLPSNASAKSNTTSHQPVDRSFQTDLPHEQQQPQPQRATDYDFSNTLAENGHPSAALPDAGALEQLHSRIRDSLQSLGLPDQQINQVKEFSHSLPYSIRDLI